MSETGAVEGDAATIIPKPVADAITALLEAIDDDENRSGALLQRATLRKAGELRRAVAMVSWGCPDEGAEDASA
jgi:hypothetical protein